MKRLKFDTIVPEMGEVVSHKAAFGVEAGEGHSTWKYFGDRSNPFENPTVVCIGPIRYDHTENRILYSLGSGYANALGGDRDLILSTKPNAEAGDPENIAESHYGYRKAQVPIKAFCNDKDEVPVEPDMVYKNVWENGQWKTKHIPDPNHKTWMKPHTDYYLTLRRVNGAEFGKNNPPLAIYHEGGGDASKEVVLVDMTDVNGELEAIEVHLGPLGTGIFIPDNV